MQIYRFYFYSKQNLDYFLINLIFAENKPIRIDMKLDHNSDKPLHIQAEEILRRLIESEEYKNGKLFPNEVELSEQLHISRNTLRQAINKLVFEGLLVRKKGYGTKVVKKGIVGGVKNWLSFSQEMKMLGIEIRNFELHISLKRPTEEIGTFFDLGSNDVQLFVRKNKDDKISKEFYYLGRMTATGQAQEFIMPNTEKTAVEILWLLDVPVREDLYEYITSE